MKHTRIALAVSAALAGSTGTASAQDDPVGLGVPPQIEEVFVLGEFIPDEKRDTSEISNVLTAEDMAVLGDSNVAASLTRVTGLSLVGGKFIYVRGLGERYSSTLLNGSPISSPVPFQKTVPLDIVPNNLVRNILVQKTYSAEYPGDFSGGLVQIRTKNIPDENYFLIGAQTGGNSKSTNGDGLTYSGGGIDNTGWDDGTRQIPKNVRGISSEEFESTEFPERAALGASFFNKWGIKERNLPIDSQGEVEFGYRYDFDNGMAVGVTGAGKYTNEWRNIDVDMRRYEFTGVDGGSRQTVDFQELTTYQTINASAFLNLGWEINNDNTISLTNIILRQSQDLVEQRVGLSSEDDVTDGTPIESYLMQWVENEIRSFQLSGEHYLSFINPDATLNWRALTGSAQRDAPDTRFYTYADNRDGIQEIVTPARQAAGDLRDVNQAPDRIFSKQDDDLQQWGFDINYPFMVGDVDITLKGGYSIYERERDVVERTFRFDLTPFTPDFVPLQTPDQLFGIDNFQAENVTVRDFTAGAANASGIFPFASSREELEGFYIGIDTQLTPRLRVQAGVRQEDATLEADAWGGNTLPGTENFVEQEFSDTLPGGSITFELVTDMQVRFGYSETRNRPSLLEITGSTIRNPDNGFFYRGNVFLEQAELQNYDARWEWYFGQADSMSLGLFYKEFDNPIEVGKVLAQQDLFTWFNADSAELSGVEYEIRKDLYFGEWFGLSDAWDYFTLGFNISYIDSEVTQLGEG
ncbi:MAG: TonB-dependent receptor, partial [Halieaceae bacterium]|nr:TonB-dependent receptor [Halieaceae bacterium]